MKFRTNYIHEDDVLFIPSKTSYRTLRKGSVLTITVTSLHVQANMDDSKIDVSVKSTVSSSFKGVEFEGNSLPFLKEGYTTATSTIADDAEGTNSYFLVYKY